MTAVAEQTGAWLAEFSRQQPAAAWVQQLRETAFQRFAELGFPTTHDEDWRFTNVAPIARATFVEQGIDLPAWADEAQQHLGKYAPPTPFVLLNTAFLSNGVFVRVPRGAVLEEPIHLVYTAPAGTGASGSRPMVSRHL